MSMSLMMLLAAATAQGGNDAWAQARNGYTGCLRQFMNASLEARKTVDVFRTELATQCTAQATSFREAHVRRELQYGSNRQRAEADAREQVREAQESAAETFTVSRPE